jgi:hypothetical protein
MLLEANGFNRVFCFQFNWNVASTRKQHQYMLVSLWCSVPIIAVTYSIFRVNNFWCIFLVSLFTCLNFLYLLFYFWAGDLMSYDWVNVLALETTNRRYNRQSSHIPCLATSNRQLLQEWLFVLQFPWYYSSCFIYPMGQVLWNNHTFWVFKDPSGSHGEYHYHI